MIWVSLDMDWITSDCRKTACCCERFCGGSKTLTRGVWFSQTHKDEAFEKLARTKAALSKLKINAVYVHDCHADMVCYVQPGDTVYLLDAHTDMDGPIPDDGVWDCWDWVVYLELIGVKHEDLSMIEYLSKITEPVNLFVSMSLPYTPKEMDEPFLAMLHEIKAPNVVFMGNILKDKRWQKQLKVVKNITLENIDKLRKAGYEVLPRDEM